MLFYFGSSLFVIIDGYYMGINAGFDKVRFLAPVKVNSRIRALAKVIDFEGKSPSQYRLVTEVTVEIEGEDKPALVAEWITIQMAD